MTGFPKSRWQRELIESATGRLGSFVEDDRAGITIFVMIFFILMLMVGGMAVDWQRYELVRADLQDALDRGVLAATNSNQQYDPASELTFDEQASNLIYGYMASRNTRVDNVNLAVSVEQTGGGRRIAASATQSLQTIFLRLIGLNTMDVAVNSGAVYAAPRLEITLVLDVSGSMGWNSTSAPGTKLAQLKVAAKEFLDTVLSTDNAAQTLITIVPFSQQVAMPRSMADRYNLNRTHDYSSCVDFHSIDFGTTTLAPNPGTSYQQGQHFREGVGSGNFGCPKVNNVITPYSNNLAALKNAIDALAPETYTATFMGMKWGTALLYPSSRPVVTGMIADGLLSADFAGWPNAWNDPSVRKITVLMSDGQNTQLNEIVPAVYALHTASWWNSNNPPSGVKTAVVDNSRNVSYQGQVLGQGDALLSEICSQAKMGTNATVYTIGFELAGEPVATAALRDCTSSPSTFYLVNGVEISTAFQNIADEIVTLKLTN